MPRKRVVMRQVREVLRLKWACGLSDRQIAQSLRISRPTVAEYVRRAQRAGMAAHHGILQTAPRHLGTEERHSSIKTPQYDPPV